MAEVSRRSSIFADRQKGDFIGSISHELRSPLHGIMASAELLVMPEEGTHPLNAHQQSLVSTVRSCGVTLLDTINHILDFSKINSFERNWHNVRKPRVGARNDSNTSSGRAVKKRMTRKEGPPLMNIYAITDIAAITEEVIEGVYAGQAYQDITSADFNEMSSGARGRNSERDLATANRSIMIGSGGEQHRTKEIEVVLDIAQGDYVFTTQPGALRRVSSIYFSPADALLYSMPTVVPDVQMAFLRFTASTYTTVLHVSKTEASTGNHECSGQCTQVYSERNDSCQTGS